MIEGTGRDWGRWVIVRIEETRRIFDPDGSPSGSSSGSSWGGMPRIRSGACSRSCSEEVDNIDAGTSK